MPKSGQPTAHPTSALSSCLPYVVQATVSRMEIKRDCFYPLRWAVYVNGKRVAGNFLTREGAERAKSQQ